MAVSVILSQTLTVLTCLYCLLAVTTAAPTRRRRLAKAEDARLSIVLNALTSDNELTNLVEESEPVHLSRSKRNADHIPELSEIDADASLTRRERRSAVHLLHTSLRLCNQYPSFCRRVEIDEGDIRIKVRLEDM